MTREKLLMPSPVKIARTSEEIVRCHAVLAELRPHLDLTEFLARVRRQQSQGYLLACIEEEGSVCCAAGYRFLENLAWGSFLYVDDLATRSDARSRGHGASMLEWLVEQARAAGCAELHLDSGVQRFAAHRFYLRQRMDITCHHFARKLANPF